MALGAVIVCANFSRFKSYAMAVAYSLTAPLGVAIGIGVLNAMGTTSSFESKIVQVRCPADLHRVPSLVALGCCMHAYITRAGLTAAGLANAIKDLMLGV